MNSQLNSKFNFFNCGTPAVAFTAVIDGKDTPATTSELSFSEDGTRAQLCNVLPSLFQDDIYIDFRADHLRCRRTFKNTSEVTLKLTELAVHFTGLTFGLVPRDDFFYHNENPRIYETMTFPIDYNRTAKDAKDSSFDIKAGNRWADPGVVCERIGRSPYQPFPAMLLGNYKAKVGLCIGSLSQRQCYHNFLLKHATDGTINLDIFSSFKAVAYREIAPGETITDWWYMGIVPDVTNIETIFNGYTAVLREVLPPMYGHTNANRDSLVWGSWNDGIYRNVSEDMLLQEARYLKKNFPTVKWIQLDDGYSLTQQEIAHGLGVPYEGEEGIDHTKFPKGIRHYTDQIRAIGLRPALWIGGFCPTGSNIFKEHPEWFIDYSYRVDSSAPLDISQKDVRSYVKHALDVLITEYGFDAVKHDFWSYAFEDSHDLLSNKERSGYEWRTWWLKQMRKRLASDGYLQTGCDIVMGNPFLGEYFTNYRYGIDIGDGTWENVRITFLWGAACFATHTTDLFVANSDSIGLFPGLNDTEAQFCNTYCMVTRTMVEIAGKLSQCDQTSHRFKMLKKCACNPNNGQEIFFAGWNYLNDSEKAPKVVYFKTAHFANQENMAGLPIRTAGLFNLENSAQKITLNMADMGLNAEHDYRLINVWTGETTTVRNSYTGEVPAHGALLIALSEIKEDAPILLDADTRIVDAKIQDRALILQNDYASTANLIFDKPVKKITVNGIAVDASGCNITVELPAKATIAIE